MALVGEPFGGRRVQGRCVQDQIFHVRCYVLGSGWQGSECPSGREGSGPAHLNPCLQVFYLSCQRIAPDQSPRPHHTRVHTKQCWLLRNVSCPKKPSPGVLSGNCTKLWSWKSDVRRSALSADAGQLTVLSSVSRSLSDSAQYFSWFALCSELILSLGFQKILMHSCKEPVTLFGSFFACLCVDIFVGLFRLMCSAHFASGDQNVGGDHRALRRVLGPNLHRRRPRRFRVGRETSLWTLETDETGKWIHGVARFCCLNNSWENFLHMWNVQIRRRCLRWQRAHYAESALVFLSTKSIWHQTR